MTSILSSAVSAIWPGPRTKQDRVKSTSRTRVVAVTSSGSDSEGSSPEPEIKKRIAIVGGGTSGLGVLIALLDLPESARKGWEIDLYEAEDNVGGVWLPDENPPTPPSLPSTPLYPALHTNTPVPTMTFPNFHYPPSTPLFPSHSHVLSYLESSVKHFKLDSHINLSYRVESASYADEEWTVEVSSPKSELTEQQRRTRKYDHLVVANGRYHHPSIPVWKGQDLWLTGAAAGEREVVHSLWYRGAEAYEGKTVVVVGFGASGWDLATQCVPLAARTYHSYTVKPDAPFQLPPIKGSIQKPRISHFSGHAIHFVDGTTITDRNVVILLGTGFELLSPFLKNLHIGAHDPSDSTLTTNKDYLRPLHHDIFSLDPKIPTTALAFAGLPWFIAVAQNSYAQGTFIAHAFADEDFLPSREEALKQLVIREDEKRSKGADPFKAGHQFISPGDAEAYQNSLISITRARSSIPLPSFLADPLKDYVPEWRRWARAKGFVMRKGWRRAVEQGVEGQWKIQGEGTTEEWIEQMQKVLAWEEEQDKIDPRPITC